MRHGPGVLIGIVLAASLGPITQSGAADLHPPARGGFTDTHVFPGTYDTAGDWSRVLEPGRYGIGERNVSWLGSLHDGVRFPILLYRPVLRSDPNAFVPGPVIAIATQKLSEDFNRSQSAALAAGPPQERSVIGKAEGWWHEQLVENFVPHGYAVAIIALRGTAEAEGCADILGPAERADIDQAATWLGTQRWSKGPVGFIGLSYDGGAAWAAAASGNEHVHTVVAMSAVLDMLTYNFPNGSVRSFSGLSPAEHASHIANSPTFRHLLDRTVCAEVLDGLNATALGLVRPERRPRDPLGELLVGDYWIDRDLRPGLEAHLAGRDDRSVLLLHGFEDWNVEPNMVHPWIERLVGRDVAVKQIIGQWGHMYPDGNRSSQDDAVRQVGADERWDWAEILLHWFDYWLKNRRGTDLGPVAQVQDAEGHWRSEASWPPERASPHIFYLAPGGALANATSPCGAAPPPWVAPSAGCAVDYLIGVDPNAVPDDVLPDSNRLVPPESPVAMQRDAFLFVPCSTCAHFESLPFDREFRFAGVPRLPLTVVPTGPAEITASLYVLDADNRGHRVGRGQIDLHFADGTETHREIEPGKPVPVALQLQALDVVVPPGSRLVLEVSLGAYGVTFWGLPQSPAFVRAGGDASRLEILTFDVDCGMFFEPPRRKNIDSELPLACRDGA